MANKSVFTSARPGVTPPAADTTNRAGGAAYAMSPKAALAQYAATGTFNDTFYSTAEAQVSEVLALLAKIDDVAYIGKVALYTRDQGRMKDMPALICAYLTMRGQEGMDVFRQIFPAVIDNGKMLRNFFQIIRSGVVGRKSFGTAPKKAMAKWFADKAPEDIFRMSVGNNPSMKDVMSLIRPSSQDSPERLALYKYIMGHNNYDADSLPPLVKEYELLKKNPESAKNLPKVPLEMLLGLKLSEKGWKMLATQMSWNQIRMNLNTLSRNGVFKDDAVTKAVATKLSDALQVEKTRPLPYQLFTAYLNTATSGAEAIPVSIRNALHDALDLAIKSVPIYEGKTYIAVDTSGSMGSPVTGTRTGATTVMACVDVASLIACTFFKKNRESEIFPFDTRIHLNHGLDGNDSIMTNADKLRKFGGGGTDCGLVLAHLNKTKAKGDLVIYVSDNESWFDSGRPRWGQSTSMAAEWATYKARNPNAKLVCIDLAQAPTAQVRTDKSVLNIGGFSDSIWEVISKFIGGTPSADHWVDTINSIVLPPAAKS